MRYPFNKYKLGTKYGSKGKYWKCGYHSGQDFLSANYGGDGLIYPLYAGSVLKVTNSGSYGNCVYVQHNDGYLTLYAHMRQVCVRPGMKVDEQMVLGIEGATGNVTGKHLHLEVHKGQYHYPASIDPLAFIRDRMGGDEVEKQLKIRLNGVDKQVTAIERAGHNYVKLQDLRDSRIDIGYDSKSGVPIVAVK
jgi:hypothetical protein